MQTLHRRMFRRGPSRSAAPGGRHRGLLFSSFLGIGLALALIATLDAQLRPVLDAMATAKVQNAVTQTLDGAIADEIAQRGITYGDIITMEKDGTGRITALTSNMGVLNGLRTGILGTVIQAVDALDTKQLSIPAGNLTGIDFLSGRGLSLPVEVVSVGSAHAEFENQFSDAGINQTRHQILLDVTVSVDILLPGGTLRRDVSAQVPVAETIIVGSVPDTYLQLGAA